MSAFDVTEIAGIVQGNDPAITTIHLGLFAIVPLLALLMGKVLLGALDPRRYKEATDAISVVSVPLLGGFAFILAIRFLGLLGYL